MGFHHQIGNNIGSQGAAPYLLAKRIALRVPSDIHMKVSTIITPSLQSVPGFKND
jgi:hypothetical protein